jgi:hypothetical protein
VRHPDDDGATAARPTARSRGLRPPWRPGQTGNPYGRGVSLLTLAARVRRITDDGQALLDFYVAVLRGQPIPVPGRRAPLVPTLDQRMHAANWLADRGWGKSPETIELTGKVSSKEARRALLSRLSDEERATLRAILQRAVDRGARAEAKAGSADPPPDQASEGPGEDLAATDAAEALTPTRRATRAREPRPRSGCREGSIRGVARAGAQEQRTAVSRVAERGSRSLRLRLQGELALAGAEEPEESKQVEHEGDHQAWILSGSE